MHIQLLPCIRYLLSDTNASIMYPPSHSQSFLFPVSSLAVGQALPCFIVAFSNAFNQSTTRDGIQMQLTCKRIEKVDHPSALSRHSLSLAVGQALPCWRPLFSSPSRTLWTSPSCSRSACEPPTEPAAMVERKDMSHALHTSCRACSTKGQQSPAVNVLVQ